jgi:hypothetical protein
MGGEIDDDIMAGNGPAGRTGREKIQQNGLGSKTCESSAFLHSAPRGGDLKPRANEDWHNPATDYANRAADKDAHLPRNISNENQEAQMSRRSRAARFVPAHAPARG